MPSPCSSFLLMRRGLGVLAILLALSGSASAAPAPAPAPAPAQPAFELIALGVEGGLHDGDLSAWLVRAPEDARLLALDAGTLLPGIERTLARAPLECGTPDSALSPAGHVLRDCIAGYFISHPHLDHVGGLLIAATDDSRKPIYGLASTLDALSADYFNWSAWPNFADRGAAPALKQYALRTQQPDSWFDVEGTSLQALLLPLQHDRMTSSMILLRSGDAYLAYFGDTGPDRPQHSTRLADAWQRLAPLARRGALRGIVIETSYANGVADDKLFGHLTPHWLLQELHNLADASGGPSALRGLPVLVTHIKPSLQAGRDPRALIRNQLEQGNDLQLRLLFPQQGERLGL